MINLIRLVLWSLAIFYIIDTIAGWAGVFVFASLLTESLLGELKHWLEKEDLKKEYDKAAKRSDTTKKGNPQVGTGEEAVGS